MTINLSKIDLQFRELTDVLLFSERKDIDAIVYKNLLSKNRKDHSSYLLDRFKKASNIYWEAGENVWLYRFDILLSCTDSSFQTEIESFLQKRMIVLARVKSELTLKYDLEYSQLFYFCKAKFQKKLSLNKIKNYLVEFAPNISVKKLVGIVNDFSPYLFKDMDEFAEIVVSQLFHCASNYLLLLFLEKNGIIFDKVPLIDLANEIVLERSQTEKNARILFSILNDEVVLAGLKEKYTQLHKQKLISLIKECNFYLIEENSLKNIKNLISLDSSIADEIALIYAKKLFSRNITHKRANADRLIRLVKNVRQISSKKILAFLAARNKMSDIKYMAKVFPEIKKLSNFV